MKVLSECSIKWKKKKVCGNCGASLEVSFDDLYTYTSSCYDGSSDEYAAFDCPVCGDYTPIGGYSSLKSIWRFIPREKEWKKRKRVEAGEVVKPSIIPVVDVIVTIGDDEVVMIRRTDTEVGDTLVLPGGHVHEGERYATAAARELEEETGLSLPPESLRLLMVLDDPGRDTRAGRRVSIVFHARLESRPELTAGSDARSVHFVSLSSLHRDEVGFDHFKAVCAVRHDLVGESP